MAKYLVLWFRKIINITHIDYGEKTLTEGSVLAINKFIGVSWNEGKDINPYRFVR
jgi:hypothetical protein